MAPPTTIGALIIVLSLIPGWFYLRLGERFNPTRPSNPLHQLLEVLAIGVATTGVSVLALVLLPHSWLPFTVNADAWASGGNQYLTAHVRAAAASITVLLGGALLISYGLFRFHTRGMRGELRPNRDLWLSGLGDLPSDKTAYLGLHLEDGRLVEGRLYAHTFDVEDGGGVVVARPIRVTEADKTAAQNMPALERIVVQSSRIAFVTLVQVPGVPAPKRKRRPRWNTRWAERRMRRPRLEGSESSQR